MRLLAAVFLVLLATFAQAAWGNENPNALAVGKAAKTQGAFVVKVNPVASFNWKTREEVLNMRRREINKYPQLLLNSYKPFEPIWSAVADKRPWWGTAGSGVWGEGPRSIEGPAEESRFVLNPYLLVGANPSTLYIWNQAAIKKEDINNPDFPYFWYPESVVFNAEKSMATATFNISKYQQLISKSGKLKNPLTFPSQFSLVAYNARDFGYEYIWLNLSKSVNVLNDNRCRQPVFIRQMLHCGGTCQYDFFGCNNMSPFIKEIDRCRFTGLPARAAVYLWRDEPESVVVKPDFTFLLEFK